MRFSASTTPRSCYGPQCALDNAPSIPTGLQASPSRMLRPGAADASHAHVLKRPRTLPGRSVCWRLPFALGDDPMLRSVLLPTTVASLCLCAAGAHADVVISAD